MDHKQKLDRERIGLNLYRLFEKSDYTRECVADFLGLKSPRVIYDWTSGKKLPSIENLWNLALLFNVRMEDILS